MHALQCVSSVAVVNSRKEIVGVIGSAHDMAQMILDPVKFRGLSSRIVDNAFHLADLQAYLCRTTDTYMDILARFNGSSVHALYVVDEKGRLRGEISLRDVIALLVREPEHCLLFEKIKLNS